MNTHQKTTQAVVATQAGFQEHQGVEKIALFNTDGTPYNPSDGGKVTFAPVTTGTAIDTAGKTTTSPEPAANTLVVIKFTNGNSAASPTVAFNGGTARAIHLGGAAAGSAEVTIAAGGVAVFWFDGTVLHQVGLVA